MIRVAAVGDLHAGADAADQLRDAFAHVADDADVLLFAGDLTRTGDPAEAQVLAEAVVDTPLPIVAVLGNHDHHSDRAEEVTTTFAAAGVRVLEGEATTLDVHGTTVGVSGVKGFGGGFEGACATEFGEPETKAYIRHTKERAEALERSLATSDASVRIALMHYSPIRATLEGEHPEIYPWLGSFLLGEACDRGGANLVIHGHAHAGRERGRTAAGIPVRNVALPVLGRPYAVYTLEESNEAPHLRSRFALRDTADASA
ncbi:MAG TPA: metallophosphoesterase [Actinomycetota bacterium]|nr:metallophosphoesterase [Actinomycetota bacterium]